MVYISLATTFLTLVSLNYTHQASKPWLAWILELETSKHCVPGPYNIMLHFVFHHALIVGIMSYHVLCIKLCAINTAVHMSYYESQDPFDQDPSIQALHPAEPGDVECLGRW